MKDYPFHMDTYAWNAIRYILITLTFVPIAEALWARAHARWTGLRIQQGHTVQLRRSRLGYWGLHQEVDHRSTESKILAILICIFHISGSLFLEYGSSSRSVSVWKTALISPSFPDGWKYSSDAVYFMNAGYIYVDYFSERRCIDGAPKIFPTLQLSCEKFQERD